MSDRDDDLIRALSGLDVPAPDDALMQRIALDAVLEHARVNPPRPSDLLMARIARDATAAQPKRWREPATWGGLIAAGIMGLMIGFTDTGTSLQSAFLGDPTYDDTLTLAYDFQYMTPE